MKIKICGLKYPENILDISNLKPDYLGFIFYDKSKRYVLADKDVAFSNFMFNNEFRLQKVGVFVNEDQKNVIRLATMFDIQILQLHGDESPAYCEELQLLGFEVIKAFGIDEQFDFSSLDEYENTCSYFLFDTKTSSYGGAGIHFDWNLLKQYHLNKPIFLSGGLELNDIPTIHDLLNDIPIHALDFNSKLEIDFGVKDVNKCSELIAIIRNT